jgi:membrane protease YdiL (CAAX protease family)
MASASHRSVRQVVLYVLIAFTWSWGLNLPRVLATAYGWTMSPILWEALGYLAVFGPAVAAFGLTARIEGRAAVGALWKRGWRAGFDRRWWLPILLLWPAVSLLGVLAMRLVGEPMPWEYGLSPAMVVPVFLLIYLFGALPEEYGWRGYALGRLQSRWGALTSSLILGLIWGLWHLPLHFIAGTTQAAIPVWQYLVQTIVMTVLYTWIYDNTGGSVLAVALFHAMGNIMAATIPYYVSSSGRWINFGILLIVVILVVALWGPARLVKAQPTADVAVE